VPEPLIIAAPLLIAQYPLSSANLKSIAAPLRLIAGKDEVVPPIGIIPASPLI